EPLVEHFIGRAAAQLAHLGRAAPTVTPAALAQLERHDWPGNVRELANAVERAVILGGDVLGIEDFRPALEGQAAARRDECPFSMWSLDDRERVHIERVVDGCMGNLSRAARVLGINRTTLWKKRRAASSRG